MQINTYLSLPVGAERHLSVPLNIHERAGHSERESSSAALYVLIFISVHILMGCIKSEWPNREFHNDNGIHHTCVLKETSPSPDPLSVLDTIRLGCSLQELCGRLLFGVPYLCLPHLYCTSALDIFWTWQGMIDGSCASYLCCTVVTVVGEFVSVPPLL